MSIKYDLTLIREISNELKIPIEVVKKAVFTQYKHYADTIREGNGETCRAHFIGKWKNPPYKKICKE